MYREELNHTFRRVELQHLQAVSPHSSSIESKDTYGL